MMETSPEGLSLEQIIKKFPPQAEMVVDEGQIYSPQISRENGVIVYVVPGWSDSGKVVESVDQKTEGDHK